MKDGAKALGLIMAALSGLAVGSSLLEFTKISAHSILAVTLIWGAMFWSFLIAGVLATYLLRDA